LKGKRLKPVIPADNQPIGCDSVGREELNRLHVLHIRAHLVYLSVWWVNINFGFELVMKQLM
jgi:hypothetical protein